MHYGSTCVLDHNTYNLYLSAHNTRGPTVHMGVLYMWANNTCGPTIQVGLLYTYAHNTPWPTVHEEYIVA